jgi:two-component system, OmpR family, response regulator
MTLPRSAMRPTGVETGSPDVPPNETVSAPPLSLSEEFRLDSETADIKGLAKNSMRVLVIEDDRDAATWLVRGLRESGHLVDHAADGEQGLALAGEGVHDVLIVDRMLPKLDGLSLIRSLRADGLTTPVLILSALSDVDERVRGLRAGGDDYLAKPYAFSELLARVEGLSRRNSGASLETRLKACDLEMDLLSREVTRAGKDIPLQPREFKLLEYLMRHAGHIVTRTMLLENVWDYHFDPQTNVIDVHVSRLRSKIDKGFSDPILQTVRGAGYMIRDR